MDPKATLAAVDQAISDGDHEQARERLIAYYEWRRSGGFEPVEVAGTLMRGDEFASYCQRRLEDV